MALKKHYEKIICACCFLFLCVNIGFPSTSFNVYQPYLVEIPGVGNTGGSMILACRSFVSLLCMFGVAKWYQRLNCRLAVTFASLFTALGFAIFGLANSFIGFLIGAVFAGMGYGLGGMVGMTLLISRWYKTNMGTAIGIASVGSGFASITMPIIITHILETSGMFWAFMLEALLAAAIAALMFVLIRNNPEDMDRTAHEGAKRKDTKKKTQAISYDLDPRPKRLFILAMVFMGCLGVDGWAYLSVLMTSSGFDVYFAATALTICGLTLALAKGVSGKIFDMLGSQKTSGIFFVLMNVGLILCCFAGLQNKVIMISGLVLFSLGVSLATVGISIWSIDLSTIKHRVQFVRNLQLGYAFGGFIFNLIPGVLMDLTGTYTISYALLVVMGIAEMCIVLGVYRKVKANSRTSLSAN